MQSWRKVAWRVAVLTCVIQASAQWNGIEPRTTDLTIRDICFSALARGWAVGDSGLIMHTSDGGVGWLAKRHSSSVRLNTVSFSDAMNGLIGGANGTILRTTDGGTTWTEYMRRTTFPVRKVLLLDSSYTWVLASDTRDAIVLHSRDAGSTWHGSTVPRSSEGLDDLWASDTVCAYVAGAEEKVFKTVDAGRSWGVCADLPAVLGLAGGVHEVFSLNRNCVWVVRGENEVLRSSDGGTSWEAVLLETDREYCSLNSIMFVDAAHGWCMSPDPSPRVFSTNDSGITWSCDSALRSIPEWLHAFELDLNGRLWVGGEFGAMYVNNEPVAVASSGSLATQRGDAALRIVQDRSLGGYSLLGRSYGVLTAQGRAAGYRIWWNGNQAAGVVTTTGREHHVVR